MNIQKKEKLERLINQKLLDCVSTPEYFNFLRTQSRLYKYTFPQQLHIYAQNPDVTATATFGQWTKQLGRRIRVGSSGIPVPLSEQSNNFVHVFDIQDTIVTARSKPVYIWQLDEQYQGAVSSMLLSEHGASGQSLAEQLLAVSRTVAARHIEAAVAANTAPILQEKVQKQVLELVQRSTYFELLNRCGFDPSQHCNPDAIFLLLQDLTYAQNIAAQKQLVYTLGLLTGGSASTILRRIEQTVKLERSKDLRRSEPAAKPEQPAVAPSTAPAQTTPEPAPEPEPAKRTVQDIYNDYQPMVLSRVLQNEAFFNALHGVDEQTIKREANAAIKQAVLDIDAPELTKLYFGLSTFHNRLHKEILKQAQLASNQQQEAQPEESAENVPGEENSPQAEPEPPIKNVSFSDYEAADLSQVDADLRECLTGEVGLLSQKDKEIFSLYFRESETNRQIAQRLARAFAGVSDSVEVHSVFADYEATETGFELEIPHLKKVTQTWEKVSSILRALYDHERDGFFHEPTLQDPSTADTQKETSTFSAQEQSAPRTYEPVNFRIADDHLGEGGPKAKYAHNVEAIRTLRQVEAAHRPATAKEQQILSHYVGWGGVPEVFDERKENWSAEYHELKNLLTPAEYSAARDSILNAHYTSPTVIRAIYDAVNSMGFTAGNILEPSCGTGNFFGLLPEHMADSQLYGVELDSVTGRIAKQLYPKANITVAGFETTNRPDFFDLAIGNVPFGNYRVNDPPYNSLGFNIHNYFFAKALDQVRPGGIVAFITSRYTLDAKSTDVRDYLAQRAELLGAIRLPNNAFKANAGTSVVTDILFLKRREEALAPSQDTPEWVSLGTTPEGFHINRYFVSHPEMVLGTLAAENTQYGREECTVVPLEGADLADQLNSAVARLPKGIYQEAPLYQEDIASLPTEDEIPADPAVRNFSYTQIGNEIFFRENDVMKRQELKPAVKQRVSSMIALRDTTRALIQCQLDGGSDVQVAALQAQLNSQYDAFTAQNGRINSRLNAAAFHEDSSYYLLCSLERYKGKEFLGKSAMFNRRTVRQNVHVSHCGTPQEALAVSLNERGYVDIPFMAGLTDIPEQEVIHALRGQIYLTPESLKNGSPAYEIASEYLSGDVRKKLSEARQAAETHPELADNVKALEAAQPERISAADIEVHLGATWVPVEYVNDFIRENILSSNGRLPYSLRWGKHPEAEFSPLTGVWNISMKTSDSLFQNQSRHMWGIDYSGGYALQLLEASLNLKEVTIKDRVYSGSGDAYTLVVNEKQTAAARAKQAALQERFSDWIFADPERRSRLEDIYNEKFNSCRPREFDGSYMTFPGMSPDFTLRPHQSAAVAHALFGGNTLFAHTVGAGKTAEMITAAMEGKRLGLCQKAMFVVPKHTIEQFAGEFMRIYPAANILVARPEDFSAANRKKFCARIATGDYDAVILSFSQFEKIPVSMERQEQIMQAQIDEIINAREAAQEQDKSGFSAKQLVSMEKRLKLRLDKLRANERKDDVVTFEELGIDRLFIDEAHYYKNAFLATKMTNVAGIGQSASQKCADLDMKCQYLDEITGGRGIVFATGTPVSNTMSELYIMQRYLQRGRLKELGLDQFDNWASTFGQTESQMELAPEGSGYRMKTRFSRFYNVPELMRLFKECADVKMPGDLHLEVPDVTYHTVVAQPTPEQKEMVKSLSARAAAVHRREVSPDEDNMLKITSDGKKIGLDARMVDPGAPDEAGSKINLCVENVYNIWKETASDRLTQIIFCDFSTPNPNKFNAYHDIRDKLIARGVPREEIAFIHDYNTDAAKDALFAQVRAGEVRVLLGSTFKLGVGTNVQNRLIATHDLDAPWRPGDLEQRAGRIIRQGNQNPHVDIYRYVTNGTFDSYLFQILENKQKFISQILSSKVNVRACKDADEAVLNYAEIKSLCAGDPRIREKMTLEVEVQKLKMLKSSHNAQIFQLQDDVRRNYPKRIQYLQANISAYSADLATLKAHPLSAPEPGKTPFAPMVIMEKTYAVRRDAGAALIEAAKAVKPGDSPVPVGSWRGMTMEISRQFLDAPPNINLVGRQIYSCEMSADPGGNITRMSHRLEEIPALLSQARLNLEAAQNQLEEAKALQFQPFAQEAELSEKLARLSELTEALNLERSAPTHKIESADAPHEAPTPSLSEQLHNASKTAQERNAAMMGQSVPLHIEHP